MAEQPDLTGPPPEVAEHKRLWTWMKENKTWVFSGIGTALMAALLSYFLSQSGSGDHSVKAKGNITIEGGIIQTGDGTITTSKPESKP